MYFLWNNWYKRLLCASIVITFLCTSLSFDSYAQTIMTGQDHPRSQIEAAPSHQHNVLLPITLHPQLPSATMSLTKDSFANIFSFESIANGPAPSNRYAIFAEELGIFLQAVPTPTNAHTITQAIRMQGSQKNFILQSTQIPSLERIEERNSSKTIGYAWTLPAEKSNALVTHLPSLSSVRTAQSPIKICLLHDGTVLILQRKVSDASHSFATTLSVNSWEIILTAQIAKQNLLQLIEEYYYRQFRPAPFWQRILGWIVGVPFMLAKIPVLLCSGLIEDIVTLSHEGKEQSRVTEHIAQFGAFLGPLFTSFLNFSQDNRTLYYDLGGSRFLQALNNALLPFLSPVTAQLSFWAALWGINYTSTAMHILQALKNDATYETYRTQRIGNESSWYRIDRWSDFSLLGLLYFITFTTIAFANMGFISGSTFGDLLFTSSSTLGGAVGLAITPPATVATSGLYDDPSSGE